MSDQLPSGTNVLSRHRVITFCLPIRVCADDVISDEAFQLAWMFFIPTRVNADRHILRFAAANISGLRFVNINVVVNQIALRQQIARLDLLTFVFITIVVRQLSRTDDCFAKGTVMLPFVIAAFAILRRPFGKLM